jgi:hypothetical protein
MMPPVISLSTRSYAIEPVDLSTADDDILREVTALTNAISLERVPEDLPLSFKPAWAASIWEIGIATTRAYVGSE